jgi:Leucine-rich repeat (LRR) protein
MKTVLYTLLSLLLTNLLNAQIVNIPDPNFKAALVANTAFVNTNGDNEIQLSEAQACTAFDGNNKNINDLTGIEEFVNLNYLRLRDNNVTTADLSALTQLMGLDFSSNSLTSLTLPASMPNLDTLNLSYNQLSSVDLSGINIQTTYVHIHHNQLTRLTLPATLTGTNLHCYNNQLDSLWIADGVNEVLCYSNQLVYLAIPTTIDRLNAAYNQLDTVAIPTTSSLRSVDVSHNNIEELYVACPAIRDFNISHNQLTQLSFYDNSNNNGVGLNTTSNPSLYCIETNRSVNNALSQWTTDIQTTPSTDCSSIWNSMSKLKQLPEIHLFPNPTNNDIRLNLGHIYQRLELTIHNSLGQQVLRQLVNNQQFIELALPDAKGIYWLQLKTEQSQVVLPVIKE